MIRDHYQQTLDAGRLEADAAQARVIEAMQRLEEELVAYLAAQENSLLRRLRRNFLGPPEPPRGIYIWGGVGRGKTLLMNLLHDSLPTTRKLRLHFHHFMLDVHARLNALQRGETRARNPLLQLAKNYAARYSVICLDEFIVTNITDAMLLYGLLDALFERHVTLVMTSNRVPDDLYLNGLQRERFLPAIELIKNHTRVLQLDGDTDHRLDLLEHSNLYYSPITAETDNLLEQQLHALATGRVDYAKILDIYKRPVQTIACADEIVWFDFAVLCSAPRAAQDYIALAREFHTLLLSNVPQMGEDTDDLARRFIYLIDELYDKNVKLIMSAATQPDKLYCGEMLQFPFNRTSSRLIEMRTEEYLSKPHLIRAAKPSS